MDGELHFDAKIIASFFLLLFIIFVCISRHTYMCVRVIAFALWLRQTFMWMQAMWYESSSLVESRAWVRRQQHKKKSIRCDRKNLGCLSSSTQKNKVNTRKTNADVFSYLNCNVKNSFFINEFCLLTMSFNKLFFN